jgi:hypothetical protein
VFRKEVLGWFGAMRAGAAQLIVVCYEGVGINNGVFVLTGECETVYMRLSKQLNITFRLDFCRV